MGLLQTIRICFRNVIGDIFLLNIYIILVLFTQLKLRQILFADTQPIQCIPV